VREHQLTKNNNKILQEEKMAKIQMLYYQRGQKTNLKKKQRIQSKKIHTISHSSMRKMTTIKKIKNKQGKKSNENQGSI